MTGNRKLAKDDGRVPDLQFNALMTKDELTSFLNESLDNEFVGIRQSLMLAACDRSGMVAMLRTLDDEDKKRIVEGAQQTARWTAAMAEIAESVSIRSLVAVAEIAGMLKPPARVGIFEDEQGSIAGDPHKGSSLMLRLAERNALIERLDTTALSEAEAQRGCRRVAKLDRHISMAKAASKDDVVAKLLLFAQVTTEGHDADPQEAIRAIRDAQTFFGIGRISPETKAAEA